MCIFKCSHRIIKKDRRDLIQPSAQDVSLLPKFHTSQLAWLGKVNVFLTDLY